MRREKLSANVEAVNEQADWRIFDAVFTGVTPHGTFIRVMKPHVEGLLAQGYQGLDVGDKLRAKLTRTDVQHYIDFVHA